MKKHIFETKKTKLIARVMLLVLLLASALSFAGCGEPHVKKGQYYQPGEDRYRNIALKAVSDTEEFAIDNVTFQLYIGLRRKEFSLTNWITKMKYTTKTYDTSKNSDHIENLYYVVAIINENLKDVESYNSLEGYNVHILKEIPYEEAFKSGIYDYIRYPNGQYYYNYSQTITIPPEYIIDGEYQYVGVLVCLVEKLSDGETKYGNAEQGMLVSFQYIIRDDGTVMLDFKHRA